VAERHRLSSGLDLTTLWPLLWLLLLSRRRIRRAVGVYADLVDSSVDLYVRDVANQLWS
jgi:hypothetical protein